MIFTSLSSRPAPSLGTLTCRVNFAQGLLRPRADGDVLGQIDPANRARRVDIKFRRSGNVVPFWTGAAVQNIITLNDRRVRVRQKRKGVSHFLAMGAGQVHRINTNRYEMNAAFFEVRKPFLKTPQLGVTKRSPMSAIKN